MERRLFLAPLLIAGCFTPGPAAVAEGGSSEGSSGAVGTLSAEGPGEASTGADGDSDTGDVDETTGIGSSGEPSGTTDDTTDGTTDGTTDDTTDGTTGAGCTPAVFDQVEFDAACFQ